MLSYVVQNHRNQNPASPKPTSSSFVGTPTRHTSTKRPSLYIPFNFVRIVGCKPYLGPLGQVGQPVRDSTPQRIHQTSSQNEPNSDGPGPVTE